MEIRYDFHLLLFSCKNSIFGDKFVSEMCHGELILSAKMISCHQSIFFETVSRRDYVQSRMRFGL